MKKRMYVVLVIMLLSSVAHSQEKSVKEELKTLCTSDTRKQTVTAESTKAQKIFEMMSSSEQMTCGVRGDDYLDYLLQKYEERSES